MVGHKNDVYVKRFLSSLVWQIVSFFFFFYVEDMESSFKTGLNDELRHAVHFLEQTGPN